MTEETEPVGSVGYVGSVCSACSVWSDLLERPDVSGSPNNKMLVKHIF
jgi:hypothetical protein